MQLTTLANISQMLKHGYAKVVFPSTLPFFLEPKVMMITNIATITPSTFVNFVQHETTTCLERAIKIGTRAPRLIWPAVYPWMIDEFLRINGQANGQTPTLITPRDYSPA